MDLLTFLRRIPKVELHVHLTGAVEPETLAVLAKRNGVSLPDGDLHETLYHRASGAEVKPILPTLKIISQSMITARDFHRVAYDIQRKAAEAGVRHREIFWNPTHHATIGEVPYEVALEGLISGLTDAEAHFSIRGRLIPSIDREQSPEAGLEMVEWVVANPHDMVLGIGMDYLEIGNPPEKFWKSFKLAGEAGLKRTAHAGEFLEPARNVETCLDLLKCDRIDHGYTVVDDLDLVARCRDEGMVFTVVPTNSTYLRVLAGQNFQEVHPLRKMGDLGLRIVPNSDDPPLHKIDPASAYLSMIEDFGFTLDDLRNQMENGIEGAWVSEDIKRAWKINWLAEFDRLRPEIDHVAA